MSAKDARLDHNTSLLNHKKDLYQRILANTLMTTHWLCCVPWLSVLDEPIMVIISESMSCCSINLCFCGSRKSGMDFTNTFHLSEKVTGSVQKKFWAWFSIWQDCCTNSDTSRESWSSLSVQQSCKWSPFSVFQGLFLPNILFVNTICFNL